MSAICRECGKEIAYLVRNETAFVSSRMFLDETGESRLKEEAFEPENVEFCCPKCQEVLTAKGEDAAKILKGEKTE